MGIFIEYPVTANALANRKPIYGVGINDAPYVVKPKNKQGVRVHCPYYARWLGMLTRCYGCNSQRNKTYIGCVVSDEWLHFLAFKKWMITQDWEGMHLDKDIINPKNKIYSKTTCCFISAKLNCLLTDSRAIRGKYPQGVIKESKTKKIGYRAYCKCNGKRVNLGTHDTVEKASLVYRNFKSGLFIKQAKLQTDIRIKNGLYLHSELLLKGE